MGLQILLQLSCTLNGFFFEKCKVFAKKKDEIILTDYLKSFSAAILADLIVLRLGTHFTTRFGSALMGECILMS